MTDWQEEYPERKTRAERRRTEQDKVDFPFVLTWHDCTFHLLCSFFCKKLKFTRGMSSFVKDFSYC